MSNADTVRSIYAAFGTGEIPSILEHIAPAAELEHWTTDHQVGEIPYLQPRKGPDGFGAFFEIVGTQYEIKDFQVLDVIGDDRQVVVEVLIHNVTPTGKEIRDEELHLWTFGDDGKVVRMRHYIDTAQHLAAHT